MKRIKDVLFIWGLLTIALIRSDVLAEKTQEIELHYRPQDKLVSYFFQDTEEYGYFRHEDGEKGVDVRRKVEHRSFVTTTVKLDKDACLRYEGKEFALDQDWDGRFYVRPLNSKGRTLYRKSIGKIEPGPAGKSGRPLPLEVLTAARGFSFPWLPDDPVAPGESWSETMDLATPTDKGLLRICSIRIDWKFEGIKELRRFYSEDGRRRKFRKCAEITFELHGKSPKLDHGEVFEISGHGRLLFDIEHGLDVVLEKTVRSGPVKGGSQRMRRYTTKKVLSENVLLTPEAMKEMLEKEVPTAQSKEPAHPQDKEPGTPPEREATPEPAEGQSH